MRSTAHSAAPLRRRTITVLCALLTALALAGLPALPAHAAPIGVTTAYVARANDGTVSVIDTSTGAITATVTVGGYPQSVAVSPNGTRVYVSSALTNVVSVIDASTLTVIATIPVGTIPKDIVLNPAGTTAYVINQSGHSVSVIDTATNTVTATVPGIPGTLQSIALTPDAASAYVPSFNPNTLTVIDTATNAITASAPLGGTPYAVAVNPAGTAAYVALGSNSTIATVATGTNTVTATFAVPTPIGLDFTPDGSQLYAVNGGGNHTVTVIDPATNTITATIPGFDIPSEVRVDSAGSTAYVTNNTSPNGSTPGQLLAIDTATGTLSTTTPAIAGSPRGLGLFTVLPPTVTAISPASGPPTGGTQVTITGTRLADATAVTFGANPATGLSCTATSCTVTAPAGAAGTVDVRVTGPGGTSAITAADRYTYVAAADIDVNLGAQPHLGILVPSLAYTLTAHNTGPDPVTSATLTATLPPGKSATNLAAGCTTAPGTVTCTYGTIASGASTSKTFRLPLNLLSLGQVTVTGTRTTSAPADPDPANDNASATCTVISIVLATCS
ncbi:IPT/TIG domain-containing protein [Streptosporangium roseum]|uniref:IPT/TIG domain-containing protein n=1 Tax=Streptosporangium roseum TaxID=2001 RepID=UPI0004CD8591|nr:IPT/TIG domain-containing protein [Streptosporangium roseum]